MNRKELCKMFDISLDTSFRWQRKGMPAEKIKIKGLSWRWNFDKPTIEKWLNNLKDKSKNGR